MWAPARARCSSLDRFFESLCNLYLGPSRHDRITGSTGSPEFLRLRWICWGALESGGVQPQIASPRRLQRFPSLQATKLAAWQMAGLESNRTVSTPVTRPLRLLDLHLPTIGRLPGHLGRERWSVTTGDHLAWFHQQSQIKNLAIPIKKQLQGDQLATAHCSITR